MGFLLPHSRKQELEADRLGLLYVAMAGYNPEQSVLFWETMGTQSKGQKPPEFASTHPAEATRIAQLKAEIPKVMPLYQANKVKKS